MTYKGPSANWRTNEHEVPNEPVKGICRHTNHYACEERLDQYGANTHCCRCTGHQCPTHWGMFILMFAPAFHAYRLGKQVGKEDLTIE